MLESKQYAFSYRGVCMNTVQKCTILGIAFRYGKAAFKIVLTFDKEMFEFIHKSNYLRLNATQFIMLIQLYS